MIYKFRLISSENEDFFRDIEVRSEQTFLDFHNGIQESVEFDGSQIASFFLTDDSWEKGKEIPLMNMMDKEDGEEELPEMADVILQDIISKKGEKLLYVFDFFADRMFFVELMDIKNEAKGVKYPLCTNRRGENPDQLLPEYDIDEDFGNDYEDEVDEEDLDDMFEDEFKSSGKKGKGGKEELFADFNDFNDEDDDGFYGGGGGYNNFDDDYYR